MNFFSRSRFQRLFLNDLMIYGKKVLIVSAGGFVVGLLVYFLSVSGTSVSSTDDGVLALYRWLFPIGLLLGGFVLTSMIFNDMHHPVERYFYLMQPVSNFERLLSRYLISGPLFYLYFVVAYFLFEVLARALSLYFMEKSAQFFEFNDLVVKLASHIFFAGHVVVLLGAIYFRSYSLIKTKLALTALGLACMVVLWFSMRLIFWDYFPSLFSLVPREEGPGTSFNPAAWPSYIYRATEVAVYVWVLFVAYAALKDHEA
jgi:hypothetical protein